MTDHIESTENFTDYIGEIVSAICEDITDQRILAKFAQTERVFVSRKEVSGQIKVGDKIDIYIDGITKTGLWAGSIEKIGPWNLWKHLEDCRSRAVDIDAVVISAEENGLVCGIESAMAFMPKREIEESPLGDLNTYKGQKMKVRILKFSASDGRIIISHKAAVAEEMRESREQILAQLKVDQTYEGKVRQIVDFGAFVDIGAGIEGLVHRSNLSWGNEDPASVVSIGQTLRVVVLAIENGRISLGHKQLIQDNWAEISGKHAIGDIVEGKVTTFANFGAFVRIDGQFEGLVHNTELSWNPSIRQAQQILELNQNIRVRIIGIDAEKRRLSLSLKRVDSNPWQDLHDACPAGTRLTTKISNVADFGIFVELQDGLRGLIHKNDLPRLKDGESLESVYHPGDEIECIMVSVDVERQRAGLSVRQLEGDPFQSFAAQNPVGRRFDAIIKRIASFGAFAAIGDVEGLIHISELSENRVENVGSVVSVGQDVQVTVVSLDEKRRRIGLSLIAEPFDPHQDAHEDDDKSDASENGYATLGDVFPQNLLHS